MCSGKPSPTRPPGQSMLLAQEEEVPHKLQGEEETLGVCTVGAWPLPERVPGGDGTHSQAWHKTLGRADQTGKDHNWVTKRTDWRKHTGEVTMWQQEEHKQLWTSPDPRQASNELEPQGCRSPRSLVRNSALAPVACHGCPSMAQKLFAKKRLATYEPGKRALCCREGVPTPRAVHMGSPLGGVVQTAFGCCSPEPSTSPGTGKEDPALPACLPFPTATPGSRAEETCQRQRKERQGSHGTG